MCGTRDSWTITPIMGASFSVESNLSIKLIELAHLNKNASNIMIPDIFVQ